MAVANVVTGSERNSIHPHARRLSSALTIDVFETDVVAPMVSPYGGAPVETKTAIYYTARFKKGNALKKVNCESQHK
jgi:hypothetical protein